MIRKTTARSLIRSLGVLDEDILMEAAQMPKLFARAAKYRVDKMRVRMREVAALDVVSAREDLALRRKFPGREKTEAYFKGKIILNLKCRDQRKKKELAEQREELAKLLLDAYKMRRDAIKIVSEHSGRDNPREEALLERSNQMRRISKRVRYLNERRRRIKE